MTLSCVETQSCAVHHMSATDHYNELCGVTYAAVACVPLVLDQPATATKVRLNSSNTGPHFVMNAQALLVSKLKAADTAHKLRRLATEHRTSDQLNASS